MAISVGDLRRFIAGSPDNRGVSVVVLGLGAQDQVSLQNIGNNLTVQIRARGAMQDAMPAELPDEP